MGNCLRRSLYDGENNCDMELFRSVAETACAPQYSIDFNYNLHIYMYKKQMLTKGRGLAKRCRMKLTLTEDIIRVNYAKLSEKGANKEALNREIEDLLTYRSKLMAAMYKNYEMSRRCQQYKGKSRPYIPVKVDNGCCVAV